MLDAQQIDTLTGAKVVDSAGAKVGKVAQVYLSNADQQVEWVTVSTGLFGTKESFAPARDASWTGDAVQLNVTEDQVKGAPQIDPDGEVHSKDEQELYTYYHLGDGDDADRYAAGQYAEADTTDQQRGQQREDYAGDTVGHDTSGPTTDEAMTRSKEELRVGTQTTEAGRARLRKYVTTEQQTVTVPVSHEEVTLQREPITDANRDQAESGPTISEEEHEVVLHAEQPVVQTEAMPVERVSLGKQTVTENQEVSGEVREEHIELDNDGQVDKLTDPNQNRDR